MHPVDHADLRSRVQRSLTGFLDRQRRALVGIDAALVPVADAVERFVLGGGKRLRPAFAYWGYLGAGGPDSDQVVHAVSALELVQASALIHDDLIDASATRRGEPAIHRRFATLHSDSGWAGSAEQFGAASAILLGDLCLVWSDEMLRSSGLDPIVLGRARVDFDDMRTEVIAGQYLDVHAQATTDTSEHRAHTVARYKSAKYTVERPLLFGGALADGGTAIRDCYSRYGLALGEAFQLRDDVLGVFGDPAQTGKPAGDDLREGKHTFLVAAAFAAASPAAADRLRAGLGDPTLDPAGVEELRDIITATGAARRAEQRINELTDAALDALTGVELAGGAGERLIALAAVATCRTT